ncbi:MAG: MGMT family protein [Patescibacteria group bacterium]|nr:MGMT family protein [Patescibacteria group bacterium]
MVQKFSQVVYDIVRKIPPGKTLSYLEVAELAGSPKAFRAVGNALHNAPPSVPCHRIVAKCGKLASNFGKGGIKKQKELLEKEGVKVINGKIIIN